MRCTGADTLQRLEDHCIYQTVLAASVAQPVPPFDVPETVFAQRARTSTQHAYTVSKCRAETCDVHFWRHRRLELGLHAWWPLLFERSEDLDGDEKYSWLCS